MQDTAIVFRRILLPKLSEKGRRSLRCSFTEHLNGTFRPISASLRLPNPYSECCSYSFSDSFKALDFSHLSQSEWVAHRPSAQRETISRWLHTPLCDVAEEAPSSAPKGATLRLLARFPGSVALLLALCVPLCYSCASEETISACEGF
jgi:hypothetical protein